MATYSANTTIKVSAAVTLTGNTGFGAAPTIYTVPANSYLKIAHFHSNLTAVSAGTISLVIAGITVKTAATGQTLRASAFDNGGDGIIVGPGQTVTVGNNGSNIDYALIGTLFTNTP